MVGIYKVTNPKGKIYIGLSKNIELRWKSHKNLQFRDNIKLKESLVLYGVDSHLFEIVEEIDISELSLTEGNALLRQKERYWIKKLDTFYKGLNLNGGGSGCGSQTPEAKQKISKALKGKPKPKNFGENRNKEFYTQEWRDKISQSNKGRKSPMEGKIGPNKGKIMGDEQKLKISKSNKGKPKPQNFLLERKKQVLCLNTNQMYESISEAAKQLNLPISGVSQCCRGKRKYTKGYEFKFIN